MALFPAYTIDTQPSTSTTEDEKQLSFSSFQAENVHNLKPKEKRHKSHKKKRKRSKTPPKRPEIENLVSKEPSDEFIIDTTRTKEFLTVPTISRPSAPKYHIKYRLFKPHGTKKRKFKRYYRSITATKQEEGSKCFEEGEFTQRTAKYNRNLVSTPHDVNLWLEFINFQDTLYQYEKTTKKGSIAKAQRNLADRKLLILDKALMHNPNSEAIHRERLRVAVHSFPLDELQSHLKALVDKEPDNLIFWQGYIESTQCSMSHCSAPTVLKLYNKCLSILHQLRRNATIEKHLLEESILRMLYQCGLFMKQAGLFEQLWTLLKLYLELNLFQSNKYETNIDLEGQLMELEDVVFKSNLPLHELWLRIEKLREACHWLPSNSDSCEDPQRIVLIEDVSELIHPITRPENVFKLFATILTLLKVPLLPCRHVTMQNLGLDYVPWAVDSIESILACFFPVFPTDLVENSYLLMNFQLYFTNGPQYLKVLPGQEEYLMFVMDLMKKSASYLEGEDQTACIVWFIRFQRLLLVLQRQGKVKFGVNLSKIVKNQIKQLLKTEQFRNNEIFYAEYAMVELELNETEVEAVGIVRKTLKMRKSSGELQMKSFGEQQVIKTHLTRVLVELLMKSNETEAVQAIIEFVDDDLSGTERKFKLFTIQLLENEFKDSSNIVEHFLPNFCVDFLILHGWFVFLTKSARFAGELMEKCIEKLREKANTELIVECLYEFYATVMFKECLQKKSEYELVDEVLKSSIEQFPNNLYLLGLCAKKQTLVVGSLGTQFWPVKNLLLKSGRAYAGLFALFIGMIKLQQIEEKMVDTVTGEAFKADGRWTIQVLALFKRVTSGEMEMRRCGLIWRLYLHFVYTYYDAGVCRNVYYTAVEECPWLKALYVDAAVYIPAELAKIQDLIIEKELRLHVTPEELEVLRS